MSLTTRLVIQIDSTGNYSAELPGLNGHARQKIDLIPGLEWECIDEAMQARRQWLNAQNDLVALAERRAAINKKVTKHLHYKVWDITSLNHNHGHESGKDFADRTIGTRNGKQRLKDLLKNIN